eukprot:TRINITY_DN4251_c0_g1_i14.p1 TRINITY_DN4251_c0_g1~~TRINITY_DN4251_c0_g1_i14.p1  ORF type:complete len:151 (-),score=21.84 TRINITY_DN4251_c0_g1_i14:461-913(-)
MSSLTFSTTHQYIHCTGNMFVLIPTTLQMSTGIQGIQNPFSKKHKDSGRMKASQSKDLESDNVAPISKHLIGESLPQVFDEGETGFLWSWNFMISKKQAKWKQVSTSGATGDIPFMDKMLADFRRFCMNEDGRLKSFWDECLEKQSLMPQ